MSRSVKRVTRAGLVGELNQAVIPHVSKPPGLNYTLVGQQIRPLPQSVEPIPRAVSLGK